MGSQNVPCSVWPRTSVKNGVSCTAVSRPARPARFSSSRRERPVGSTRVLRPIYYAPKSMTRTALILLALVAGQNYSALQVEAVAAGFPGGEGPVWSREGFLIFSDYSRDRLYKYVPGGAPEVYREDSHGANGNTMDRQGRLYSCEYKARRVTRTDRKGQIEVFVDQFEGKRFNAPNDIVARRDGHLY